MGLPVLVTSAISPVWAVLGRELLSVETIFEARRTSAGCQRLAYTSIDTVGIHPNIVPPRTNGSCTFIFVGEHTLSSPGTNEWVYIVHKRTRATRWMSACTPLTHCA